MIPWMQDSSFMKSLENDDIRNNYLDDRFRALKKGPVKSKKGVHFRNDYIKLLGFGVVPAIVGYAINYFILSIPVSLWFISIVFVIAWMVGCYKLADSDKNSVLQAIAMNAFGFLMLGFVLYQELIVRHYFLNIIGMVSQVYFTPILVLGFSIETLFVSSGVVYPAYIISMIIMFIITLIGISMKKKK